METNQYQTDANATCSPLTPEQLVRLSECRDAIGHMTDLARPALHLADVIKKYVYYGRPPERSIPHFKTAAAHTTRSQSDVDLIHAMLGLLSEGEEILTPLKKITKADVAAEEVEALLLNLKEETGDCAWYLALLARGLGVSLDAILAANIRKLHQKRFKDGQYSDEAANNRNLDEEAKALANDDTEVYAEDRFPAEEN